MAEAGRGCVVSKLLLIAVLLLLAVGACPGVAAAQTAPTVTPLSALPIVFQVGVAGDVAGLGGGAGGALVSAWAGRTEA